MAKKREKILGYDVNKKSILYVDATPNDDYPLRILRAYREDCDVVFTSTKENPLLVEMNRLQVERAKILDRAISKLCK